MEEKAEPQWAFGRRDLPQGWPVEPDGRAEPGALLAAALSELDGAADVIVSMLEAFGVPAVKAGVQGKVILGFAGLGVDVYVPQSRLEEARALLNAPAADEDAPDGANA